MEDKILQSFAWMTNILIISMILYICKSALGIDFVKKCHADQVLLGTCNSNPVSMTENFTFK